MIKSRFRSVTIQIDRHSLHPGALRPFSPARVPFYYGWIILVAGALGILFSVPGQTTGVSVFTDHLLDALGLTRVRISSAYMAGTLASALLMTRAGRVYDRLGARTTAAGAAVFLGLCLVFFTRIDRISGGLTALISRTFSGDFDAGAAVPFILVCLGFLGIRFFGQGVLTLVSRTMVMRWFDERRGRVAALMGIPVSAGFALAPRFLQAIIDRQGWRGAWGFLAAGLFVVALPMILLFFRDTPERCGLEMEGGLRHLKIARKGHTREGADATLREARRDPRYWAYTLFLAWWSLYNTAFTFHVVDIFATRGIGAAAAVSIFIPITVISLTFNFLGSWASDAMDLPPLYFTAVLGLLAAGLAMLNPEAGWSRIVLIIGMGVVNGLWSVLSNLCWPRLFGREHLGEISGSVMSFLVAGSAVGPWLFSVLRSPERGYTGAGVFGLLGPVVLAVLGVFVFFPRLFRSEK